MPYPGKRYGSRGHGMPREVKAEIARRLRRGERYEDVAAVVGVTVRTIFRFVKAEGVPRPRRKDRSPRHLSVADREEIRCGLNNKLSFREIAARLGRSPGTISREVAANGGRDRYRAYKAEERAEAKSRRPKPTVFERNEPLRVYVEAKLKLKWSPQEISRRLIIEFPDDPEMRVSHETIYQTLFVQGRGGLRKELARQLRTGRTKRKPHGRTVNKPGRIVDMVMISERPAEAADRAVPGHWEGDLVIGTPSTSAIATLVERTSGFAQLAILPNGRTAPQTREALTTIIRDLPDAMRRTLTWDQGNELAQHAQLAIDADIDIYFCDPHSPWQRPSNENFNGLLRQYFPKGTDLRNVTQAELDAVADELNGRPRRRLDYLTPSEVFNQLVASAA